MAKRNGYNVTAYGIEGKAILTEHYSRVTDARRVAREFLAYENVKTVDVDNARYGDCGDVIGRFIKTGANSGVVIVDGEVTNIRFQ